MERAFNLASKAVKLRLAEQKPEMATALELKETDVTVIPGVHDHVQNIVDRLGIKYSSDVRIDSRVVFINCGASLSGAALKVLKKHIENGATVVTSDWALTNVVSMFPNLIERAPKSTGDEVVAVEGRSDSLWAEIAVPGAEPQWWLESASYTVKILDREKVKVEAASHEMLSRFEAPVVAFSFQHGKGSVFHVVSHFWHKRNIAPNKLHQAAGAKFLELGMRLSKPAFDQLAAEASQMNFSELQSACTATELIAQLIARQRLNS